MLLATRGLSSHRVAEAFSISERTVETHIGKILNKLELASRTQLASWMIRRWSPSSDPS